MGLFDFLFGKKKITLANANKLNEAHIAANSAPKNDEDALMQEASSAMTSGNFDKSIQLYQKLADTYSDKKGRYLSQVGAAYYFLEDYAKAIEYYIKAKENGADSAMIDDNIWEACETIYEADETDTTAIEKYLEYYPNGSYTKKAKWLVSK